MTPRRRLAIAIVLTAVAFAAMIVTIAVRLQQTLIGCEYAGGADLVARQH